MKKPKANSAVSSLITLSIFGALNIAASHAASTSALVLSGKVAAVNDITVTPNGSNNTSLNILAGESDKKVASVSEVSNNVNGYKVQMYSANGGQLRLSGQPSKYTTYQISYSGGTYVTPPLAASPSVVKTVSTLSALTTATSAVLVNVSARPTALAGTYSDTLTFSVIAN